MFVVQFLEECTYRSKYGNSHIYKNTKPDSNMKRVFSLIQNFFTPYPNIDQLQG